MELLPPPPPPLAQVFRGGVVGVVGASVGAVVASGGSSVGTRELLVRSKLTARRLSRFPSWDSALRTYLPSTLVWTVTSAMPSVLPVTFTDFASLGPFSVST